MVTFSFSTISVVLDMQYYWSIAVCYINTFTLNLFAYWPIETCKKAVYDCIYDTQKSPSYKIHLLQHAVIRWCDLCQPAVLSAQLRWRDLQLPRGLRVTKAPRFASFENAPGRSTVSFLTREQEFTGSKMFLYFSWFVLLADI